MKTYWLLMAFFAVFVGAAPAQENASSLVEAGEKFSAQRRSSEAIEAFLDANRLQPNNPDILWRLGREYCHLMEEEPRSNDQIRLARVGHYYAERASKIQPTNALARAWNAYALQETADRMVPRGRIATGPEIHREALAATEADPNLYLGWLILGRWELDTAQLEGMDRYVAEKFYGKKGIPEASVEQAVEYFKKAVELAPNRIAPRLYLGKGYQALDKQELARAEFEKALDLPAKDRFDESYQKEAKSALKRVSGSYL